MVDTLEEKRTINELVLAGLELAVCVLLAGNISYIFKSSYPPQLRFMVLPMMAFLSGAISAKIFKGIKEAASFFYFSTAAIGIILLLENNQMTFFENLMMCVYAALGFLVLLVIIYTIYKRTESKKIPYYIKGEPVILCIIGIISLIISGLK
jgi:hypothetical protein